jgi:hypothetical protein
VRGIAPVALDDPANRRPSIIEPVELIEIIEAQVREIEEMKKLIAELEANPFRDDAPDLPPDRKRRELSVN